MSRNLDLVPLSVLRFTRVTRRLLSTPAVVIGFRLSLISMMGRDKHASVLFVIIVNCLTCFVSTVYILRSYTCVAILLETRGIYEKEIILPFAYWEIKDRVLTKSIILNYFKSRPRLVSS